MAEIGLAKVLIDTGINLCRVGSLVPQNLPIWVREAQPRNMWVADEWRRR